MPHRHTLQKPSAFRRSAADRLALAIAASAFLWLFAFWAMDWI
jgi:hypothetical protein